MALTLAVPPSGARAELKAGAEAGVPDATVAKLQAAIRNILPEGWSVSYEKETHWLEIKRREPLLVLSALPNSSPDQTPQRGEFLFAFRVRKLLPMSEYQQQHSINRRLAARLGMLYDKLVKRRVSQKFDSFAPVTEEDKALVEEYEKVKAAAPYDLPDFFYDDISLDWAYNDPKNPVCIPADNALEKECREVLGEVTKLLSTYEPPRRPGIISWD